MKPIKVLLVVENNAYPRDFRVRREAHALRDAGCAVSVLAPRSSGQPWRERLEDVEVYRFPAPPDGDGLLGYLLEFGYATLAILFYALWIALRRGVDVVHAANPPDTLCVVGAVFRLLGKRFVFDQHDLSPDLYLSRFKGAKPNAVHMVLQLLERCSYAAANVVITTNETYRKHAIEDCGVAKERVFVVRNGPPSSYTPLPPADGLAERAQHLIGYVGTIGPQDGVDCWMRTIHHLVTALGRRDFLAVVIGDGDALPAVRALASELGIESYVLFTGRLSETDSRRHLSATAVCVQPDPSNALNDKSTMNKLMEYMALGKPTVAFDLPETRVSGGDAVIYVPPNDELAFAYCVAGLLDAPAERDRRGAIGYERVSTALAWEFSVPHLLRAYREGLDLAGDEPVGERTMQLVRKEDSH
jgi:glycosyltransferase involved in cell wall biosynthesis